MTAYKLIRPDDLRLLDDAAAVLNAGFDTLPEFEPEADSTTLHATLQTLAEKLQDNYPYAHPLYAGQMLKPPHPVARAAYQLAQWINPNNHALDGGRATSALEKEAVAEIAAMFSLTPFLGHLTSSGTLANLEALWIAGKERPGQRIVGSSEAHYTHARISDVLKLDYQPLETDDNGRIAVPALQELAASGVIGTVVATAGTTSFGAVDPIADIIALGQEYGFRVHIDGAYGGYFGLADLPETLKRHYTAIAQADSIAIDPHKHGLQPYGCGCVLFSDPSVGRYYQHDSPYTYFSSNELHLGEISLECSRAGAAAAALWATQSMLPLTSTSEFAKNLSRCRRAAQAMAEDLAADARFALVQPPELDIVVWAVSAETASRASHLASRVFDIAAENDLHLALIEVDVDRLDTSSTIQADQATITCLRSCLMKPEHEAWQLEIFNRLVAATEASLAE
ncbi:MAG: pyridoxal-dependent decarboxylase [Pseudomonadota bacterium]